MKDETEHNIQFNELIQFRRDYPLRSKVSVTAAQAGQHRNYCRLID